MAADDISAFGDSTLGDLDRVTARLDELVEENRRIHERESLNLDPASNVMNPRAEALLGRNRGDVVTEQRRHPPGRRHVTVQRMRLVLSQYADSAQARIDQIRQHEVDQSIGAAKGDGRLRAIRGQREQPLACPTGKDDREHARTRLHTCQGSGRSTPASGPTVSAWRRFGEGFDPHP